MASDKRPPITLVCTETLKRLIIAGMPERPKGADCKSAGYAYVGSNPSPGTGPLSSAGRALPW